LKTEKTQEENTVANNKILIHISDRDKWLSVIGLVNRLLDENNENHIEIIIIADIFAGAVCLHCNQSLKQQMIDFVETGQRILICEESLKCLNIPMKSLPDFVQTIPLSLTAIIQWQDEGFHYIKI
jgi:intracellular sulfur oxidation DsrE/DsrF family protein